MSLQRNLTIFASALVLTSTLSACDTFRRNQSEKLAYIERPAETLYLNGFDEMNRGRYDEAILYFGEVERQHPYSEWARRSMLMSAYANYMAADYEQAITSAERFISLHPGNNSAPYAYYLIALCYYEQIYDVGRDQKTTEQAREALQQVVRRYPDSQYAADARLKLELTHDHLAGKEMAIGRWYQKKEHYLAAINRYKNVVRDYQTTSHVEEAMHRLVETYVSLGIFEEAVQVGAVLGYNYPTSQWYQDTYDLLQDYGVDLDTEIAKPREQGYWERLRERLF